MTMGAKRTTKLDDINFIKNNHSDMSVADMASELGCGTDYIYKRMREIGIKPPRKKVGERGKNAPSSFLDYVAKTKNLEKVLERAKELGIGKVYVMQQHNKYHEPEDVSDDDLELASRIMKDWKASNPSVHDIPSSEQLWAARVIKHFEDQGKSPLSKLHAYIKRNSSDDFLVRHKEVAEEVVLREIKKSGISYLELGRRLNKGKYFMLSVKKELLKQGIL